eukprot:4365764-Amphidinium_carterae.2
MSPATASRTFNDSQDSAVLQTTSGLRFYYRVHSKYVQAPAVSDSPATEPPIKDSCMQRGSDRPLPLLHRCTGMLFDWQFAWFVLGSLKFRQDCDACPCQHCCKALSMRAPFVSRCKPVASPCKEHPIKTPCFGAS